MKINDAITGAFFLAVAIFVFIYSGTFPAMRGVSFGPDLFPRIIAFMMGLGGTMLIVGALLPAGRQPLIEIVDWARNPRTYFLLAAIVGSVLFYIYASTALGFLLTAFLLLGVLMTITRGIEKSVSSLIITVVATVAIYLIFARMLRVPLPFGIIESMLVR